MGGFLFLANPDNSEALQRKKLIICGGLCLFVYPRDYLSNLGHDWVSSSLYSATLSNHSEKAAQFVIMSY